jgi:nucleotide-binding universal stress UspA family protein
MATHGRSGLREIVHGSVAAAVLRSGVAPVLLVRPKA